MRARAPIPSRRRPLKETRARGPAARRGLRAGAPCAPGAGAGARWAPVFYGRRGRTYCEGWRGHTTYAFNFRHMGAWRAGALAGPCFDEPRLEGRAPWINTYTCRRHGSAAALASPLDVTRGQQADGLPGLPGRPAGLSRRRRRAAALLGSLSLSRAGLLVRGAVAAESTEPGGCQGAAAGRQAGRQAGRERSTQQVCCPHAAAHFVSPLHKGLGPSGWGRRQGSWPRMRTCGPSRVAVAQLAVWEAPVRGEQLQASGSCRAGA